MHPPEEKKTYIVVVGAGAVDAVIERFPDLPGKFVVISKEDAIEAKIIPADAQEIGPLHLRDAMYSIEKMIYHDSISQHFMDGELEEIAQEKQERLTDARNFKSKKQGKPYLQPQRNQSFRHQNRGRR